MWTTRHGGILRPEKNAESKGLLDPRRRRCCCRRRRRPASATATATVWYKSRMTIKKQFDALARRSQMRNQVEQKSEPPRRRRSFQWIGGHFDVFAHLHVVASLSLAPFPVFTVELLSGWGVYATGCVIISDTCTQTNKQWVRVKQREVKPLPVGDGCIAQSVVQAGTTAAK